jgi:hypothetical protein
MADQTASPGVPWGTTVLFVIAALLYMAFLVNLFGLRGGDAMGRGMAMGFAAVIGLMLWLVLASLFAIAIFKGQMPAYAIAAAIVLLPLSAIAAASATGLYSDRYGDWLLVVPIALPPLLALYALWARFISLQASLAPTPTTAAAGLLIVLLTAVPLVLTVREFAPDPARDAARAAAEKAQEEAMEKRRQDALAEEAAQFARLGPDSSLEDYLPHLAPGLPRFQEALAGVRRVKSRSQDAATLLKEGRLGELAELWEFDIDAATVCEAYRQALRIQVGGISRTRSDYLRAAMDLEYQLRNIEWLIAARCNLDEALTDAATNLRAASDLPRFTSFADRLDALRTSR